MAKNLLTFIFTLFFLTGINAQVDIPKPMSPPQMVNDFAGLLNKSDKNRLEQKLRHYRDTTSTEIAVVIMDNIGGDDIKQYTAELAHNWGVGRKGKDNGLVILMAMEERQVAIQNGYGLEGVLTDFNSKIIIDEYMTPHFKAGDYYRGLNQATDQIILLLAGEFDPDAQPNSPRNLPLVGVVVFLLFLFILFKAGGKGGGGFRGHGGPIWIGGTGTHRGGFGGGGFSGGGFGGFGGGGFGGGGASGSW